MIDHERRKEIQTANDLVFTAYYGDAVYAVRPSLGDRRPGQRLDDLCGQNDLPHIRIYDIGRLHTHLKPEKIHIEASCLRSDIRNSVQPFLRRKLVLSLPPERYVHFAFRSSCNNSHRQSKEKSERKNNSQNGSSADSASAAWHVRVSRQTHRTWQELHRLQEGDNTHALNSPPFSSSSF